MQYKKGDNFKVLSGYNNKPFSLTIGSYVNSMTGGNPGKSIEIPNGETLIYDSTANNGYVWFIYNGQRGYTESGELNNLLKAHLIEPIVGESIMKNKISESKLIEIIRDEVRKVINEFITSSDKLQVLHNAARDINSQVFNNRGQYDASNYKLTIRDSIKDVLKDLHSRTEIIKKLKGFSAKEDEAKEFYQLPNYNVAITFEKYGVTRGTIIQFLDFNGEYPEKKGMF